MRRIASNEDGFVPSVDLRPAAAQPASMLDASEPELAWLRQPEIKRFFRRARVARADSRYRVLQWVTSTLGF